MSKYIVLFTRKKRRIPKYFVSILFILGFSQLLDEFMQLFGFTLEGTFLDYAFDLSILLLVTAPILYYLLKNGQHTDEILVQQESLLRSILENMEEGVFVCDTNRNLIYTNDGASLPKLKSKDFLLSFDEWKDHWAFYDPASDTTIELEQLPLILALKGEIIKNREIKLKPHGQAPVYLSVNGKQILSDSGETLGAMIVAHNITDRKIQEETVRFHAYHDSLTKLPNRTHLNDYLSTSLSNANKNDTQLAVMFLDLDGFKRINDTFGHDVGDLLLQEVAERLRKCTEQGSFVARMGGDEFTVIMPTISDSNEAIQVAKTILSQLSRTFLIDGHLLSISASIGITISPNDGADRKVLLKNADFAMYHAKNNGKNKYQLFSEI